MNKSTQCRSRYCRALLISSGTVGHRSAVQALSCTGTVRHFSAVQALSGTAGHCSAVQALSGTSQQFRHCRALLNSSGTVRHCRALLSSSGTVRNFSAVQALSGTSQKFRQSKQSLHCIIALLAFTLTHNSLISIDSTPGSHFFNEISLLFAHRSHHECKPQNTPRK